MRELSLFSGAGGGLLGTKLLGWEHIGYVEFNEYCQKVIAQRIKDGFLNEAPIFSDIRAFISEGYADSYKGMVDVITAGFPCQPFSVAGKQQGEDDERNMWPQTIDTIRIIRPKYALLENVPGLLAHEYARTIFRDLAESGYIPRWRILSAAEVGAPHKRDRIFIVANTIDERLMQREGQAIQSELKISDGQKSNEICTTMADTSSKRLQGATCGELGSVRGKEESFARSQLVRRNAAQGTCWSTEPDVGRVANELAFELDFFGAFTL